jgi:hypothetical protein
MPRPPTRRARLWIARLAVLLCVGAIMNACVAWGCAIWGPVGTPTKTYTHEGPQEVFGRMAPGTRISSTTTIKLPGFGCDFESASGMTGVAGSDMFTGILSTFSCRAGWPLRSMIGIERSGGRRHEFSTLVQPPVTLNALPSVSGSGGTIARGVPIAPIWLGFSVNSTMYAALVMAAFPVDRAIRRRSRRRAGLCVCCRYPIRDLPACPECGVHLSGSAAQ